MSLKKWLRGDTDKQPESKGNEAARENNPPPSGPNMPVSLEDITRGMQYAATAANELIAQQYMKALDPFFEPDADGSLIPRTVQLQLDEQHYFELPLVALSTPRGLMLEKMKVNLTIRTEGIQTATTDSGENEFGRFHVSLSPASENQGGRDSRHVDVEMQFTALPPPESVMRIVDEYTNKVVPRPKNQEAL